MVRAKLKSDSKSIQVIVGSEKFGPMKVENQIQGIFASHKIIASMARLSWVGESVMVELPDNVERQLDIIAVKLGEISIKNKRRNLEILISEWRRDDKISDISSEGVACVSDKEHALGENECGASTCVAASDHSDYFRDHFNDKEQTRPYSNQLESDDRGYYVGQPHHLHDGQEGGGDKENAECHVDLEDGKVLNGVSEAQGYRWDLDLDISATKCDEDVVSDVESTQTSLSLGDTKILEGSEGETSCSDRSNDELFAFGNELQELIDSSEDHRVLLKKSEVVETSESEASEDDLEPFVDELEKLLSDDEMTCKEDGVATGLLPDNEDAYKQSFTEIKWKSEPDGKVLNQLIEKKVENIKGKSLNSMACLTNLESGESSVLNLDSSYNYSSTGNFCHEIHRETLKKHLESRAEEKNLRDETPYFPSGFRRRAPYRCCKRGTLGKGYKSEMNNLDEMIGGIEEDFENAVKDCEDINEVGEDEGEQGPKKRFRHYKEITDTKSRVVYDQSLLTRLLSLPTSGIKKQRRNFDFIEDESSDDDQSLPSLDSSVDESVDK